MGLLLVLVSATSYMYARLRRVENELPDVVGEDPVAAGSDSPTVGVAAIRREAPFSPVFQPVAAALFGDQLSVEATAHRGATMFA